MRYILSRILTRFKCERFGLKMCSRTHRYLLLLVVIAISFGVRHLFLNMTRIDYDLFLEDDPTLIQLTISIIVRLYDTFWELVELDELPQIDRASDYDYEDEEDEEEYGSPASLVHTWDGPTYDVPPPKDFSAMSDYDKMQVPTELFRSYRSHLLRYASANYGEGMHWIDFAPEDNLKSLGEIWSRGLVVPIDFAHSDGHLYGVAWTAILRPAKHRHPAPYHNPASSNSEEVSHTAEDTTQEGRQKIQNEVLLLHRGVSHRVCPNGWGLWHENLLPGEAWDEAARRALRTNLRLHVMDIPCARKCDPARSEIWNHRKSAVAAVTDEQWKKLVNETILLRTIYPVHEMCTVNKEHHNRKALEATELWAVTLTSKQAHAIERAIKKVEHKWETFDEALRRFAPERKSLEHGSTDEPAQKKIGACTREVSSLMRLALKRLREMDLL